jgi:hypothetical protein
VQLLSLVVPGFVSRHGVLKRLFQNPPADGAEYETDHQALQVLAIAHDDEVNVGAAVGPAAESVGVTRSRSPHVGIGRRQNNAVGIGPVVM